MHMWGGNWSMGWMALWWLAGAAVVVGIVLVILYAVRSGGPPSPGESPEEILKKRYARGEMDEAEYRRRLEELRR